MPPLVMPAAHRHTETPPYALHAKPWSVFSLRAYARRSLYLLPNMIFSLFSTRMYKVLCTLPQRNSGSFTNWVGEEEVLFVNLTSFR
jgi:hypothetical protein